MFDCLDPLEFSAVLQLVPQREGAREEVVAKAIGLRKTMIGQSQRYRCTLPLVSNHILSKTTLKWHQDTLVWLTLAPQGARSRWRPLRQLDANDFKKEDDTEDSLQPPGF